MLAGSPNQELEDIVVAKFYGPHIHLLTANSTFGLGRRYPLYNDNCILEHTQYSAHLHHATIKVTVSLPVVIRFPNSTLSNFSFTFQSIDYRTIYECDKISTTCCGSLPKFYNFPVVHNLPIPEISIKSTDISANKKQTNGQMVVKTVPLPKTGGDTYRQNYRSQKIRPSRRM